MALSVADVSTGGRRLYGQVTDVAVTVSESDLSLTVRNRADDATVEMAGYRDLLDLWHRGHRSTTTKRATPERGGSVDARIAR